MLSRKIISVYNELAWKYGNVTVKDFCKYEKLQYKKNKLKLDIDFLNNCKQLGKNLSKKKDIIIAKPDKGNAGVILDWKLYDNAIQEIISDTSKFKKLSEHPTLKCEASLKRFLHKLKQKNFFSENESDKFYPSGSAHALKCTNFPLVIHFLNFIQLFHL